MHKATVVMVVAATILILPGSPSSQHTFNSFSSAKELRKLRASTKNTQGRVTVPGPAITKSYFVSWNKALNMWVVILPSTDSVVVCRTMSAIADGEPPSIAKEDRGLLTMDVA